MKLLIAFYALVGILVFADVLRHDRMSWMHLAASALVGIFWFPLLVWETIHPEGE